MSKLQVVIIEDEKPIADTLVHILEIEGFEVNWFSTATEGLQFIQTQSVDLLLLDVGLPDINGFDLCKKIRTFSDLPIIFLTARNDEIDRVVGLEIGADDYVTKPFSPREVLARVKLRIKAHQKQPQPTHPTALFYSENYDYYFKEQAAGLTALEFKVLDKLILSPRQVFSREQLLAAADASQDAIYARNIDSHIKAIRSKLKSIGAEDVIQTKRGFGYYYDAK